MFHTTSPEWILPILENGLRSGNANAYGKGVYAATTFRSSYTYGTAQEAQDVHVALSGPGGSKSLEGKQRIKYTLVCKILKGKKDDPNGYEDGEGSGYLLPFAGVRDGNNYGYWIIRDDVVKERMRVDYIIVFEY